MRAIFRAVLAGLLMMGPVAGQGDGERKPGPPGDPPPRPGGPRGERPPPGERGEFFRRMLRDCDENGDGQISFEEFASGERVARIPEEHQKKLFDRIDKDDDGIISRDDIRSAPDMERRHRERDLDKDGKISFAEFAKSPRMADLPEEKVREIFARIDRNKDGFLDRRDWKGPRRDWKRDGDREKRDGDRERRGREPRAGFAELDRDKDGVLSFEEFRGLPWLKDAGEDKQEDEFEKLDGNGDGKLQREELEKLRRDRPPGPWRERKGRKEAPPKEPDGDGMSEV